MYKNKIFAVATLLLISIAGINGCKNSKAESENKEPVKNELVAYVRTVQVELMPFTRTIQVTGSVLSRNDITVPAEEGGPLMDWYVQKGAYVRRGQIIAQIDSSRQRAAYEAALAAYRIADINFEKQRKAYEEQAISELQLKTLEYQRDAAKAQMELALRQLEKTRVIAPVDGILNERFVDAGEMIGPGLPVAHIVDVHQLKIAAGVPERYAAELVPGAPVEFSVDAFPGEIFKGQIGFIAASVTSDNRSIPIEIVVNNPGGKLKPLMIAKVHIRLREDKRAIVVPQEVVQLTDMDRRIVFVANNGRAEERIVRIDGSDGKNLRIIEGLKPGDQLITVGFQNLVDKQKIVIQK